MEELRLKKDKMFEADDLIFDHRTLEGLGNLYNSLVHPLLAQTYRAMVHRELAELEKN